MATRDRAGPPAPLPGDPQQGHEAEALRSLLLHMPKDPRRIVLLHLDSLCCLPALDHLFSAWNGHIALVVSSDRFAGISGFVRQALTNLSHSGLRLTLALGFDIVAPRIAAVFAPVARWPAKRLRRVMPLHTLREHASRSGAASLVCGDVNAAPILSMLRQLNPDLVVSFHFDQILHPAFLTATACPVVNVHPALLPAHRGPCPAFWTLTRGDKHCGVTIHRIVDIAIDAGPVLVRQARPVPSGLCMAELDERLFLDGARALVSLVSASTAPPVIDPPGSPSGYETFPDRRVVLAARRRGVRLWRLRQAVRLIAAMFGWGRLSS
jgi:methionyl-tRNA formyltransferase